MDSSSSLFLFASSVVWQSWLVVPVQVGSLGYRFHCLPPNDHDDALTQDWLFATPADAVLAGINVLIEQKQLNWSAPEHPRLAAPRARPELSSSQAISA